MYVDNAPTREIIVTTKQAEWKEYTGSDEQIAEMEYIKTRLNYDQENGLLTWKTKGTEGSTVKIGSAAGTIKKDRCGIKYIRIHLNKKRYYAHRIAWLLFYGSWPLHEVDHIDGNGSNNRINNLREVNRVNNQRNKRITERNKTGKLGVCFCKTRGKWLSQIGINNKRKHLGYFDKLEDAIKAKSEAELKYEFYDGHGKVICNIPNAEYSFTEFKD